MSDSQQNPSRPDAPVAPSCGGHAGAARLPLLIDSHCHPHFPQLGNAAEIAAEMRAGGIAGALIVATNRAEIPVVREWTREYPGVFHAALGLHPLGEDDADADEIAEWCAGEEVLAVGETGLDFFRGRETEARQRELFFRAHCGGQAGWQAAGDSHAGFCGRDSGGAEGGGGRTLSGAFCIASPATFARRGWGWR